MKCRQDACPYPETCAQLKVCCSVPGASRIPSGLGAVDRVDSGAGSESIHSTGAVQSEGASMSEAAPGAQAASVEGLRQGNWHHPDGGRIIGWHVPQEDVDRIGADAFALPREVAECVARLLATPAGGRPASVSEASTARDAARYKFLRGRLIAADFDWDYSGKSVLIFEWPRDAMVSGDLDADFDDAMAATGGKTA